MEPQDKKVRELAFRTLQNHMPAKNVHYARVNDLLLASFHLDHGWYFAKLDIVNILVLDYFGGANEVTVEDYYKATPY